MNEPTIEQMENVAVAMGFGSLLHMRAAAHYEQSLRSLHSLVQRTINGDAEAERTLSVLRDAFARPVA